MTMANQTLGGIDPQISSELVAIAESLRQSTVQVRGRRWGAGSGVIWQSDSASSLIITNAHVVRGSRAIVELSDGRTFDATVTLKDSQRDLAALAIAASNLPLAAVGDSNCLRVGELVLAVGNPHGLVGALTLGMVHTVHSKSSSQDWVQADVRLSPGNSGGPLANAQGQVIGINSMIVEGRAFAIPSRAVEQFLQRRHRPHLGVALQPVLVWVANERILGLLVLEVMVDSLAEDAGLLTGDVLIGVDEQLFEEPNHLTRVIRHAEPAARLQLNFLRGGDRKTLEVDLSSEAEVKVA